VTEFVYEALAPNGSVNRGRMDAADEPSLEAALRLDGQYLITAREAVEGDRTAPRPGAVPRRTVTDGAVGRKELLAFTEYLWGSALAGIPILTTLGDLETHVDSRRMRLIVGDVREAMVEEGKSLSEALAEHPKAFPKLYVGTVEAGETTGQLDYTLRQLVDYIEWQQEIKLQIRQATLYPIIVLVVMAGLVILLLTYVYPRLLPIFTGFDVELPLATRIVMASGSFLTSYWRWILAAAVATPIAVSLINRTRKGRLWIDTFKLRVPVFGPLIHQLEMARMVTYMALFYRTGVDLLRGFGLLEQMMVNRRVAQAIGTAREAISGGDSIAGSLSSTGFFPTVVIRSFALGESTGRLDESLERARVYYAREVPAAVKRMLATLQPILIVVLGVVLGLIAMSIFMPIMSIYQSVGR
jgi:type II secretory pathway component PulF